MSDDSSYRALLEGSGEGHAVLRAADGCVLFANAALHRILGVDAIDRNVLQAAGLDVARWIEEGPAETAGNFLLPGQSYRITARRQAGKDGDLLLVTLRQGSERPLDAPALEQPQAMRSDFAAMVIESMGQGITVLDAYGRFEYVNPAYARMVGFEREELIGKRPSDLTMPADLPLLEQAKQRRLAGETTVYDSHIVAKDGHIIDVLVTAVPMLQQSHSLSAITVVTNLAERRKLTEQLRHSSDAMRRMYEIIADPELEFKPKIHKLLEMGCHLFDMQTGIISRVESGMLEVLICADSSEMFHEGNTFPLENMLSRDVLQAESPLAIASVEESVYRSHPTPTRYQVKSYLGARVMVAGRVYGTLNFASNKRHPDDFSSSDLEFLRLMAQWIGGEIERELYLRKLQDYASQIEQKGADLAEARDQALQASKVKSEFLAMMSHEIRTPLNAVIGMNELLLSAGLNAEQSEYSRVARDAAHALLWLIDDILDFSKIEAGKLTLESSLFELEPTVRNAVQMFTPRARQKGLELDLELARGLPRTLIGDSLRLRQVLINLISNAVKFTERGKICVRLSAQPDQEGWAQLTFEVEDTGPGLSDEASRRVFDPFTQADGSTTRKYGGTGLGLSISQQLVHLMGGLLEVESEEGQGSRFWFTARFQMASPAVNGVEKIVQPTGNLLESEYPEQDRSAGRPLVLLAEDNPANRRLAIAQLRKLGYEVEAVGNGRQAINAVRRQASNYAMLLLDCRMPEVDGFGAARAVREMEGPRGRRIPIIAMTANSLQGDREACLAAGMDDYITKPVTLEKLKRTLDRWLISEPKDEPESAVDSGVLARLQSLAEDGEDFLGELIDVYLADSGRLVEQILGMDPASQPEQLRELVHALKGSSASLGASRLANLCAGLEGQIAEKRGQDGWAGQVERICHEHARVSQELSLVRSESGENRYKQIP